jgi:hypothetical protein
MPKSAKIFCPRLLFLGTNVFGQNKPKNTLFFPWLSHFYVFFRGEKHAVPTLGKSILLSPKTGPRGQNNAHYTLLLLENESILSPYYRTGVCFDCFGDKHVFF